jgi:hypothetical protein
MTTYKNKSCILKCTLNLPLIFLLWLEYEMSSTDIWFEGFDTNWQCYFGRFLKHCGKRQSLAGGSRSLENMSLKGFLPLALPISLLLSWHDVNVPTPHHPLYQEALYHHRPTVMGPSNHGNIRHTRSLHFQLHMSHIFGSGVKGWLITFPLDSIIYLYCS